SGCADLGARRTLRSDDSRPEPGGLAGTAQDPAARQRLDEQAAVILARHARVEDGNDAAVRRGADEAAEALFQRQRRLRHLVPVERILAASAEPLDARRDDR